MRRSGAASAESAVEIERGADESEVGQRLGEVALLLAGTADLLCIQPDVVSVGEHFLERQAGLVDAPGAGQRLDIPERAGRECTFFATHPVGADLRIVAVYEGIGHQV